MNMKLLIAFIECNISYDSSKIMCLTSKCLNEDCISWRKILQKTNIRMSIEPVTKYCVSTLLYHSLITRNATCVSAWRHQRCEPCDDTANLRETTAERQHYDGRVSPTPAGTAWVHKDNEYWHALLSSGPHNGIFTNNGYIKRWIFFWAKTFEKRDPPDMDKTNGSKISKYWGSNTWIGAINSYLFLYLIIFIFFLILFIFWLFDGMARFQRWDASRCINIRLSMQSVPAFMSNYTRSKSRNYIHVHVLANKISQIFKNKILSVFILKIWNSETKYTVLVCTSIITWTRECPRDGAGCQWPHVDFLWTQVGGRGVIFRRYPSIWTRASRHPGCQFSYTHHTIFTLFNRLVCRMCL